MWKNYYCYLLHHMHRHISKYIICELTTHLIVIFATINILTVWEFYFIFLSLLFANFLIFIYLFCVFELFFFLFGFFFCYFFIAHIITCTLNTHMRSSCVVNLIWKIYGYLIFAAVSTNSLDIFFRCTVLFFAR